MQVGLLDLPLPSSFATDFSFAAPLPLDGIDLLIWNSAAIADAYPRESIRDGVALLSVIASQQLVRDTRAWRRELREFMARGGTLVVLSPGAARLSLHTVQDVVGYDLLEALPDASAASWTPCEPTPVHCPFGEPFKSFFEQLGDRFIAGATLGAANDAQPIATAGASSLACGIYRYRHPGRLLMLPSLAANASQEAARDVVEATIALVARLRLEGRGATRYRWDEPLQMPGEPALRSRLVALAAQRRALEEEEAQLASRLDSLMFLALLQCGDATGVIDAAALVLHAMGGYTQKGLRDMNMLMWEQHGRTRVLVAVDDAQVEADAHSVMPLLDHVRSQAAEWVPVLQTEIEPVALYIGGNRRGARQTREEIALLRERFAPLQWLCGADLFLAYEARDIARVESRLSAPAGG
ncbi:hypothetical protein H4CHR_02026 [Variovorax sp. PBS-H4]|uniref:hypothetical protein n=1 Tax=Variovorax sp. PBS-H4 TaxID=434008 RepID=UPI0013198EC2|nr:hypothetical protein [Variovorax sp. PBS-H4]VTU27573.1 hypothetical protein H4CHR_02026 [Variovorax sp. PBS-H4]